MCSTSTIGNVAQLALVLAVGQNLLPPQVLLLHRPHALLVRLLLAKHLGLLDLHLTLIHDLLSLSSIHSLKVVWLDTVRCQHGLLSGGVLRHEVVIVGVVHVCRCLQLLIVALRDVSIALLLRKLHVSILDRLLHVGAMLSMLVLGLGEKLMEVKLLFIMNVLSVLGLLPVEIPLLDLLLNPVSLL